MASIGTVTVDVEPDFNSATKKTKGGFAAIGKLAAKAFIAGWAVKKVVDVFAGLISSASDLTESVNAVEKSYGDAADAVLLIGQNAALTKGLSNEAFNTLATQFSGFANQLATDGVSVETIVEDMTTRVADFASVMNLEVPDAALKFQSALAGETEAMRRYGIDVSAAAVETYAYANGIGVAGTALTETEKVQARYGLIMQETTKWAGDFADTSGELANQQRIASAQFENAKAKLGAGLLPIMTALFQIINDVGIPALEALAPVFQAIGDFITPVVTAVGGFITSLFGAGEGADAMGGKLGGLLGAFEGFMEPVQDIFDSFTELWNFAGAAVEENSEWIESMLAGMGETFDVIWDQIGEVVVLAMELIAAIIDVAVKAIMWVWDNFGEEIMRTIEFMWDYARIVTEMVLGVISGILDVFIGLFTGDWDRMRDGVEKIWTSLWNGIRDVAVSFIGFTIDIIASLGPKIVALLEALGKVTVEVVRKGWENAIDAVQRGIDNVVEAVKELPGLALDALSNLGSLLIDVGKDLIRGFIDGIKSMAGAIVTAIKDSITDKIPSFVKGALGIGSPSKLMKQYGGWVSEGLAIGISDGASDVDKAMGSLLNGPTGELSAVIDTSGTVPAFNVVNNFNAPVGGSMSSFARDIAFEGAKELRFAYA